MPTNLDPDPLIDAIKYADAAGVFDGDRIYADIAATMRRRFPALVRTPETLDTERLAEALFRSQAERRGTDGMGLGSHEADAAAIAAEYAEAGLSDSSDMSYANDVLLRRLDAWTEERKPGPLIRWAAAHLRGCVPLFAKARDAEARLMLAREALTATGYFTEDEVGPDVAPRITELWAAAHLRGEAIHASHAFPKCLVCGAALAPSAEPPETA